MVKDGKKISSPQEIKKELTEFFAKKFGNDVKVVSTMNIPQEFLMEDEKISSHKRQQNYFDLKPEELIAYLDQYIVKQDHAKEVLATKICTHFNRIKGRFSFLAGEFDPVGRIKNNVLMIGPTGVGKTYMVKLIAKKIGVPFVKGDATKFSETGYVGGDVEDLIQDLIKEADGDIHAAQKGIIYIDEIDKIASSQNFIGADVSRTGVQRALLKPMEETEVELKIPNDPISMIQEIERFRKTGQREKRTINTKDILFIMSGAFSGLADIISKRLKRQGIGFGAQIKTFNEDELFKHVRSEDLKEYGFESEFIGRLPVHAVFERLTETDLFQILRNPNNPIILGKKLDFAAYRINIKFEEEVLWLIAKEAFEENTGARGLVSAIEKILLPFERLLPSISSTIFPITRPIIEDHENFLELFAILSLDADAFKRTFERLCFEEKRFIKNYLEANKNKLIEDHHLILTRDRIDVAAEFYCTHIMDIENVLKRIKSYLDEIKRIELYFYKSYDINIVMEEDAIDFIIAQRVKNSAQIEDIYIKLDMDFEYGLKLIKERTGRNHFFITKEAILNPEKFIRKLLKETSIEKDFPSS